MWSMTEQKPKIVVIVGPTASGKSDLAVILAKQFHGEVVSADSRQVYKGLDVGSGKVTKKETRGVPHHMLDVASPKRAYTVAQFKRDGDKAVKQILKRGHVPIICGGTGFYVDALAYDMQFPDVRPNFALRKKLEKKSTDELFTELLKLDPRRAEMIDKHNPVRLIRAIEIATVYGTVAPLVTSSRYDICWIGISVDQTKLKERIALRITKRMRQGMVKEFINLHAGGLSLRRMEMLGLEYRYGARLITRSISKQEFVEQLLSEIVKYAKRQMTWFKKNTAIRWVPAGDSVTPIEHVAKFLGNMGK